MSIAQDEKDIRNDWTRSSTYVEDLQFIAAQARIALGDDATEDESDKALELIRETLEELAPAPRNTSFLAVRHDDAYAIRAALEEAYYRMCLRDMRHPNSVWETDRLNLRNAVRAVGSESALESKMALAAKVFAELKADARHVS